MLGASACSIASVPSYREFVQGGSDGLEPRVCSDGSSPAQRPGASAMLTASSQRYRCSSSPCDPSRRHSSSVSSRRLSAQRSKGVDYGLRVVWVRAPRVIIPRPLSRSAALLAERCHRGRQPTRKHAGARALTERAPPSIGSIARASMSRAATARRGRSDGRAHRGDRAGAAPRSGCCRCGGAPAAVRPEPHRVPFRHWTPHRPRARVAREGQTRALSRAFSGYRGRQVLSRRLPLPPAGSDPGVPAAIQSPKAISVALSSSWLRLRSILGPWVDPAPGGSGLSLWSRSDTDVTGTAEFRPSGSVPI